MSDLLIELFHSYRNRFEAYGGDSTRDTFYGDLNYDSGKIFYIVFITLFLMLISIPTVLKFHPIPILAVSVHLGYTLLSIILIALRFTGRFRYRPGILMMALTAYFFIGTAVVTASSGPNIHTYIGALSVVLMLPVFAPFPLVFKVVNILFTLVVFFLTAWMCGSDFFNYQTKYIINDLMLAAAVSFLLSFSHDRLRRMSWEKSMTQHVMLNETEQREKLLNTVSSAANVLLSVNAEKTFETALLKSFELVGSCLDVDRVQLWHNEMIDEQLNFVHRYEWLSDYGRDFAPFPIGMHIPYSKKPEWERLFLHGGYIDAPLSGLSEDDQALLALYGVKSIVITPIFLERQMKLDRRQKKNDRRQRANDRRQFTYDKILLPFDRRKASAARRQAEIDRRQAGDRRQTTTGNKGNFWGLFSINDCRRERTFSDKEVRILTSAGLMMGNAANRYLKNTKKGEL